MDYSKAYRMAQRLYAGIPHLLGDGRAFRPLSVFLEVTYRCNFRCRMCQFLSLLDDPRLKEKRREELSTKEIKYVIDQISRFGIIMFTGGEPMLRPDIMELLEYASARRKSYMVTNGILFTPEKMDELIRMGCSTILSRGLVSVGVSVEAPGEAHDRIVNVPGAFDKVMDNFRYLVEAKRKAGKRYPLLALKCVMTPDNIGRIDTLYAMAEKAGADIFNAITLYNIPEVDRIAMAGFDPEVPPPPIEGADVAALREDLTRITERARHSRTQLRITPPGYTVEDVASVYENRLDHSGMGCFSPWNTAVVSAYGELLPCSNFSVGNIREKGFMELWNSDAMRQFRRSVKHRGVFPSCGSCCSMERVHPPGFE